MLTGENADVVRVVFVSGCELEHLGAFGVFVSGGSLELETVVACAGRGVVAIEGGVEG